MRAWQAMMMGGGSGEWSPPSDCVLWFSADKSGDVSATGTWVDQSGSGNDATLLVHAYVEGQGGDRGIVFDGTDDGATSGTMGNLGSSMSGGWTYCTWLKTSSEAASQVICGVLNDNKTIM